MQSAADRTLHDPPIEERLPARRLGLRIGLAYLAAALLMFLAADAFTSGVGGCRGLATGLMLAATIAALVVSGLSILAHPVAGAICCFIIGGGICSQTLEALPHLSRLSVLDCIVLLMAPVSLWVGVKLLRAWSDARKPAQPAPAARIESSQPIDLGAPAD